MKILITGAAGNLGGLLTRYILNIDTDLTLILMQHRKAIPDDIQQNMRVEVRNADLSKPETLPGCLDGADVIVHFAGVLFKANPETFLHETNTMYFKNLIKAAREKGIKKVILISFPHVEGPSSRKRPAVGTLNGNPVSVHAQTRLEEEKHLFEKIENPVSLRVGMVYGKGVLMIDAAKWFAKHRLLGVWREDTEIHLISKTDFCRATVAAIENTNATGIYHVGDDGHDTLQSFLDKACDHWGYPRPWRMPLRVIYLAASLFETLSKLFGIPSPLTKDFIDIGRVPYFGDTTRFRSELLQDLKYVHMNDGIGEM
jgi:nucleoside-diphosphate-sugar epimerase